LAQNQHPGVVNEATVRALVGTKIYWSSLRSGSIDTLGYEYVYDLATGGNSEIASLAGKAQWLSVYDAGRNRIYTGGQAYDEGISSLSSVAVSINTTNDAVVNEFLNETGEATDDINELIAVMDDDTQIVAGEGGVGVLHGLGDYPNGTGIWTMPKATYGDATTFTRVYEDANSGWGWYSLCKRGATYFGIITNWTNGKYIIKTSTDLASWSTAVDGSAPVLSDVRPTMVYHPTQDKVYAAVPHATSGNVNLKIYNGAWTTVALDNVAIPTPGACYLTLFVIGTELALSVSIFTTSSPTHTIYRITNLGTTPTAAVLVDAAGGCVPDVGYAFSSGRLYYATCYPGALRAAVLS
jgi:hypothetical protein